MGSLILVDQEGVEHRLCSFSRICYECEEDATYVVDSELYNATRDERRGIVDESHFASDDACGKHARAYAQFTGKRATPR